VYTAANHQFASAQRCLQKGNWGMHKGAIMLENLFSIGICSRDPGQHFLAKQHLVHVSDVPYNFIVNLTMAAVTRFLAATVFFLWFWALLLRVFWSYILFKSIYTLKQASLTHPRSLTKVSNG
jgi:hypothetical protein